MPGDLAARADRMARGLRTRRDQHSFRERPNLPAFAAAFPTLIRTRPGSNAAAICAGRARWHVFLIGTPLAACLESDLGYYCPIPPLLGSSKLIDRLREALRARRYSRRTEQTYCHWVKRYIYYHHVRHPAEMGEPEINAFLTHPAVKEKVSASPQNQALCALLFLYRHVLDRPVGDLGEVIRARKPKRLPVVMTRDEVKAVPANLSGDKLMAALMYGAGLRLMECLRLRVQDIDFARREIMVRDGKGAKDCITMLPDSLKMPLQEHLRKVQAIHEKDVADGWGRVQPPMALDRKYPNAPMDWRWQWVFPQEHRWKNAATGEEDRRHVDESILQKAFKQAVDKAGFTKRATCHTLRHAFATDLLEDGYDIRTAQELLGHTDVRTTMIYTRVLNRGPRGVKSPVEML